MIAQLSARTSALLAAILLSALVVSGCRKSSSGGFPLPPGLAGRTWTKIDSPSFPSGRWGAAAALDPRSGVVYLFGGGSGVNWLNDLWAMDLGGTPTWGEIQLASSPPPRWGHTLVLDAVNRRLVLFGGINTQTLSDTWVLELSGAAPTWRQLTFSGSVPPARRSAVAAYDAIRGRMLLFGGHDGVSGSLADLWSLDLTPGAETWTRLTPAGTPPAAREFAGAVFHAPTDRLYLFGGESSFQTMNDLHVFEASQGAAGQWTRLTPAGGPGPRSSFAMALDGLNHEVLVLFGTDGLMNLDDAWLLDVADPGNVAWTQPEIAGVPPTARLSAVLVHDPARRRFILQGGNDGAFNTETWSVSAPVPTWVRYPGTDGPTARFNHAAAYDADGARLVVHGGFDGAYRDDTWAFATAPSGGEHWRDLGLTGPSRRFAHTMVPDPAGQRLILFAGSDGTLSSFTYFNDVWALDLVPRGAESWTRLTPTGSPPSPRDEHVAVFDPTARRMLVHGGFDDFTLFQDAWILDLSSPGSGSWTSVNATGAVPPGLAGHAALFDATGDRMIIHGGGTGSGWSADTRALEITGPGSGVWSVLASGVVAPTGRNLHVIAEAPGSGRMFLFGGQATRPLDDLWSADVAAPTLAWTESTATVGPPALSSATLVPDPINRRLVLFGGLGSIRSGDVWFLYPDGR